MRRPGDTIMAPATASGRAAIAIIRLSGPQAGALLQQIAGRLPPPRRAVLAALREPASGTALDQALVLWLPGPRSFSGEDMAELHLHGGRAVLAAVLRVLGDLGARPAEAGEFAWRAYHNGKMDLTAAEGLADLIDAETEAQRQQALRQMEGDLAALYHQWRSSLLHILAHTEAAIDFSDEELPPDLLARQRQQVQDLLDHFRQHHADRRGVQVRDGWQVALVGAPNAGKSSLLNALMRRDVAIVSATPGTTRDIVEATLDLAGQKITIADMAGLRASSDAIEQEGIRRARARAAGADLRLLVINGTDPAAADALLHEPLPTPCWVVATHADLGPSRPVQGALAAMPFFSLSNVTGAGLEPLLAALAAHVAQGASPNPLLTRERHRQAIATAIRALEQALRQPMPAASELFAEELRSAANALGRVTGLIDAEQLLDVIFRDFCLGK